MDRTMLRELQNADVFSTSGHKIGSVGQVYLDDRTEKPTFVTVKTGLFGTKETFVPLDKAQTAQSGITVPFEKDFMKDAPNVDADANLSPEEEHRIYEYYSMDYQGDRDGRRDQDRDGLLDGVMDRDRMGDVDGGAQDRTVQDRGAQEGFGDADGTRRRPDGTGGGERPSSSPPRRRRPPPHGAGPSRVRRRVPASWHGPRPPLIETGRTR